MEAWRSFTKVRFKRRGEPKEECCLLILESFNKLKKKKRMREKEEGDEASDWKKMARVRMARVRREAWRSFTKVRGVLTPVALHAGMRHSDPSRLDVSVACMSHGGLAVRVADFKITTW
ncbi:hypothetical protein Taro_048839 [Colocasia esculenta]|uniref:Uncharacterized protein n=1 Tax=Colocasia esculenta TaxID=4460 RepID=A0A843X974_COLES|nr:hypothetical protein [Colocasia esculenta]